PQVLASRYPSSSSPWLSPPRSLFPSFAAGTDPHPGWFHEPPLWVTLLPPEPSILTTMRKTDGMLKLAGLCVLAGILVAGLLFPVVGGLGVLSNKASETVKTTSAELARKPPPLTSVMLDDDGDKIATLYAQYRLPLSSEDISPAMKWAMISVEDRRFFEHNGVDMRGITRAAIDDSVDDDTQGASTLTQQYVKNYLINVVYRNDEEG